MADVMRLRRGTAAQWSTVNPVLNDGEFGFAKDANVLKLGDGVTSWNELPIALSGVFVEQAEFDELNASVGNLETSIVNLPTTLDDTFATKAELNALPESLSEVFVEKNQPGSPGVTYATTTRPSASVLGAGTMIFDTTLNQPLWSNGDVWVNAIGAAV